MGTATVVKVRKQRGPNQEKPREFIVLRNKDMLTLTIGGVQIPGLTNQQVRDLVWNNAMQGGRVLLNVTAVD